ncbi:hypothetical protein VNO80_01348 [Phaseolus coccineus]|uniref:Uncharacterized protein n=1 Tax=Phaseolus coccineus TaxID=3886 RepID=A0AAN9RSQ2_PHACN
MTDHPTLRGMPMTDHPTFRGMPMTDHPLIQVACGVHSTWLWPMLWDPADVVHPLPPVLGVRGLVLQTIEQGKVWYLDVGSQGL